MWPYLGPGVRLDRVLDPRSAPLHIYHPPRHHRPLPAPPACLTASIPPLGRQPIPRIGRRLKAEHVPFSFLVLSRGAPSLRSRRPPSLRLLLPRRLSSHCSFRGGSTVAAPPSILSALRCRLVLTEKVRCCFAVTGFGLTTSHCRSLLTTRRACFLPPSISPPCSQLCSRQTKTPPGQERRVAPSHFNVPVAPGGLVV